MGDGIVLYQTDLVLSQDINFNGLFQVEIPSIYTVQHLCQYFGYDAVSNSLTPFRLGNFASGDVKQYQAQYSPASGIGGVIVATSDQQVALGIFGAKDAVDYYTLWNFTKDPPQVPHLDFSCSKLTAVKIQKTSPMAAGTYWYTSHLVMGTLAEVQAKMQILHKGEPLPQAAPRAITSGFLHKLGKLCGS